MPEELQTTHFRPRGRETGRIFRSFRPRARAAVRHLPRGPASSRASASAPWHCSSGSAARSPSRAARPAAASRRQLGYPPTPVGWPSASSTPSADRGPDRGAVRIVRPHGPPRLPAPVRRRSGARRAGRRGGRTHLRPSGFVVHELAAPTSAAATREGETPVAYHHECTCCAASVRPSRRSLSSEASRAAASSRRRRPTSAAASAERSRSSCPTYRWRWRREARPGPRAGAEAIVSTDVGCLMHLEGRARRRGLDCACTTRRPARARGPAVTRA